MRKSGDVPLRCLFFSRVWVNGMPLDFRRWARHSRGRSLEIGERLGSTARRRRTALPARLLPPISQPIRVATGILHGQRFSQSAGQHGLSPGRQSRHRGSEPCRTACVRASLESASWTGVSLSAGYEHTLQRAFRRPRYYRTSCTAGDREMRIRQEILLGIGGYRALQAIGLQPTVYHMNEGHSAFLALEHILHLMRTRDLSLSEARELASASLVFTTHTPVEAGHDYFHPDSDEPVLSARPRDSWACRRRISSILDARRAKASSA